MLGQTETVALRRTVEMLSTRIQAYTATTPVVDVSHFAMVRRLS